VADESTDKKFWLGGFLGLTIFACLWTGSFVYQVVRDREAINPSADCSPTSNACLHGVRGYVVSSSESGITVAYDDGLRKEELIPVGSDVPTVGRHVMLERWHGDPVSVYDPLTRHRYRGARWPHVDSGDIFMSVIGGLFFAGVVLWGLRDWRHDRRARA
jgi:hypothetical protein